MNIAGITFNEADAKVLLVSQPSPGRLPVDVATLHTLLTQEGYGNCLLDEAAIEKAAHMCNAQDVPFGLQVAQRLDAMLSVQVDAQEMTASLSITAPHGGKAATLADAMQALKQTQVVFGIDGSAVTRACQLGQCSDVVVARGTVAQDGADARFETLIPETVDREPKLNESGLIDYREHGDIAVVPAGAPLMRRTPAIPGMPGQTVKGRELPAVAGHDATFATNLDGAEPSRDDPNLLVASVSGQPVRVLCGVKVEPVLRVREVNMATGNIHFDGTVHVSGEVVQGMTVQASGDIVVDGMVEGGQLDAGGNIEVAGGVIAHAKLHAGGSVKARFAEGVTISAGTLIAIGDMVVDCELHSQNQIIIGANSPEHGRLLGGTATAAMLLQVPLLGSSKAAITQVVVGTNPELQAKYAALLHHIEEEKIKEANLEKLIKQLKATGDPKGMLERVKVSRQHAVQMWGQSLAEKAALEKEMELARSAKLVVTVGIEGAVDLSIGTVKTRLRQEFDDGTFSINPEAHVVFTRPDGKVVLVH
jgi:uncharacterized protein (DUF342 family)